jgi:hypothetical protein
VAARAKPIYELIAARAQEMGKGRRGPAAADGSPEGNGAPATGGGTATTAARSAAKRRDGAGAAHRDELCAALTALLCLPEREGVPHYRVLRPMRLGEHTWARYAVETEGNLRALLHKRLEVPARSQSLDVEREVHLYLPHLASEEDVSGDGLAAGLLREHPLYALDVRGLGESMPEEGGGFLHAYGMDYMFHGHALLLEESYLGRRVHDTLSTVDLLAVEGARRIHLYGRGQGAILALFAAMLDDRISRVTLENGPLSYEAWTQVPLVAWPSASFLRAVLAHLDLPDLIRALGRHVRLVEPWGPDMKPLRGARLTRALNEAGLPASLLQRS